MRNLVKSKKPIWVLIIAVVLVLSSVNVFAQPAGSGWWTGFTIQNADQGNEITVVATAFGTVGETDPGSTSNVNIPDGFAVSFNPGLAGNCSSTATNGCRIGFTPEFPAGFEGAVVVSSDGPAVAIAQVNNNPIGNVGVAGGAARGGYQGTGGTIADTTLYFPTVKNNFSSQSTAFYVQAAGTDASVTINYTMNDGTTYSEGPISIPANQMYVFIPSAASIPSCNGGTGDGCIGGAVISSTTGPVAGTVVEYQEGVSVAKYVLSTRGLVPNDTGTIIIAPTMKSDFFGGTTGASVYNTSPTDTATVDLDFVVTGAESGCSASAGDTASDQITVPPQSSVVVSRFRNNIGNLPACTFFAMTASTAAQGGENIAVTVNETRNAGSNTFKAVYTGFNTVVATPNVFFPLVKEDFFNNTTGVAIVNAGDTVTQVDVTYSGTTGTHVLRTVPLDAGEAVSLRRVFAGVDTSKFTLQSGGLPSGGNRYSVTATAVTNGVNIVGLAQEAGVNGGSLDVFNLEGFNQ